MKLLQVKPLLYLRIRVTTKKLYYTLTLVLFGSDTYLAGWSNIFEICPYFINLLALYHFTCQVKICFYCLVIASTHCISEPNNYNLLSGLAFNHRLLVVLTPTSGKCGC